MLYWICFRCYYQNESGVLSNTEHRQQLTLADIPKWLECYKFTHPTCKSITVKIWWTDNE